ncbi:MAG TPA: serine kinase, partial [Acidobacteriota bacterium]|nr:serine kinase [Acidobacteriota bacterium]
MNVKADPFIEPKTAIKFFDSAYQSFQRSEQIAGDTIEHFYKIADYVVCLRFAGSTLVPLITPALEHLKVPSSDAALTICIWESEASSLQMPPAPPWSWSDYIVRGEVNGYNDDPIYTAFHVNSLNMLDGDRNLAIYWVRDASQLPYYETGSPLLRILHWWMRK